MIAESIKIFNVYPGELYFVHKYILAIQACHAFQKKWERGNLGLVMGLQKLDQDLILNSRYEAGDFNHDLVQQQHVGMAWSFLEQRWTEDTNLPTDM